LFGDDDEFVNTSFPVSVGVYTEIVIIVVINLIPICYKRRKTV